LKRRREERRGEERRGEGRGQEQKKGSEFRSGFKE
jgi:hypothetical protein